MGQGHTYIIFKVKSQTTTFVTEVHDIFLILGLT